MSNLGKFFFLGSSVICGVSAGVVVLALEMTPRLLGIEERAGSVGISSVALEEVVDSQNSHIQAAYLEKVSSFDDPCGEIALLSLIQVWAESNPEQVLHYFAREPMEDCLRKAAFMILAENWGSIDVKDLELLCASLGSISLAEISQFISPVNPEFALLLELGEAHADGSLDLSLVFESPDEDLLPRVSHILLHQAGFGSKEIRSSVIALCSHALAEKEGPEVAIEWASRLKSQGERWLALSPALREMAESDSHGAFMKFTDFPGWSQHEEIRNELFVEWSDMAPSDAMTWLREQPWGIKQSLFTTTIAEMAVKDPVSAMSLAKECPELMKSEALRHIASAMAVTDPHAALEWLTLTKSDHGTEADQAAYAIGLYLAQQQGQMPSEHLLDEIPGAIRPQIIRGLVNEATLRAPDETLAWITNSLMTPSEKESAVSECLTTLGHFDYGTAIEKASLITDDDTRRYVLNVAARSFAKESPSEAFRWLQSLPEDDAAFLATEVVQQWDHPYEVSAATADLPAGRLRDAAAEAIAKDIASFDPQSALEWSLFIEDTDRRRTALLSVWFELLKSQSDLEAVRERVGAFVSPEDLAYLEPFR